MLFTAFIALFQPLFTPFELISVNVSKITEMGNDHKQAVG